MQPISQSTDTKSSSLQQLFESGEIHKFEEEDYINQAFDFIDQNQLVDCKLLFEEGLKKFPHSAELYFEFGYFLFENGENQNAKESLMKVVHRFLKITDSPSLSIQKILRLFLL
jgi:TolA-binding protein